MLTPEGYNSLASYAFSKGNPGYKPTVVESPDGDDVWDAEKRYAHVAPKYLGGNVEGSAVEAWAVYEAALVEARRICDALGIPKQFYPGPDSTLRILHYPPGATTAPHEDFDLFTLSLYRDDPTAFRYLSGEDEPLLVRAREVSPGIHFGEILTEVLGVPATRHMVQATLTEQHSVVFFVVPSHDAVLPSGITVGEWLAERKARSRKTT